MVETFDVIVLGLGANGSSALYNLSKAFAHTRQKVVGIDRFTPPHQFGSSHGQSRIIRQAYYENPVYVPFVKEAYRCWLEIEKTANQQLFLKTGGLMLGREDAAVITGSKLSAETHGIAYEYLPYTDLQKRFPAFKLTEDTVGLLEEEAGILFPEKCIRTFLDQAQKNGATLRYDETVLNILPDPEMVEVITTKGRYRAAKLIISAGAWVGELVANIGNGSILTGAMGGKMPDSLQLPLTIERQVLYWFKNKNSSQQIYLTPRHLPVYIWEYRPERMFYGFPDLGEGIKIGYHHAGRSIKADELTQSVSSSEIDDMKKITDDYLNMNAVFNDSSVCMYTNTPDINFLIDYHPEYKNVIIASPCSGHGFKFSSLTGRLLSEMATGKKTALDISPFSIRRGGL